MQTNPQQQFYFHADAVSLGGYLDAPSGPTFINTPSSVALSASGGFAQNVTKAPTNLPAGIKVASATTLVTGLPSQGGWIQRATCIVEGLDVFGVITADSLVAQVSIEQPAGGKRKITFSGTNATNLKVDGKPITIDFEKSLVPPATRVAAYNEKTTYTPDVEWDALNSLALSQNQALFNSAKKDAPLPAWVTHNYGWIGAAQGKVGPGGYTLCSLANQIDGNTGGSTYGHCIELPQIGRICIAEVLVYPHSAQLSLINTEFNGKKPGTQCGRSTICMLYTNGSGYPPNL